MFGIAWEAAAWYFPLMAQDRTSGQNRSSGAETEEGIAVAESPEEKSPFRYYVKGEKIREDAAFFELLLARVIRANGGLSDFDEVWPRAVQSLAGLNICRLSNLSGREMEEAIGAVGGGFGACLVGKADALVHWAEAFWRIRQIYGSFRQYIRSFDSEGFDVLLADVKQRLEGLSVEFLTAYLREAGEKPPGDSRAGGDRPSGQRSRRSRSDKNGAKQSRGSGRRRGQKANAKSQPAKPQPPQAKSPDSGEQKATGRARRGRFFRRKRGKSSSNSATA